MSDEAVTKTIREFEGFARESQAQIFISGGHGGLVTYDGRGGRMQKEGGPVDRIFLLRSLGELGGNIGLDIEYGSLNFFTGELAGDVQVLKENGSQYAEFTFAANKDKRAVQIMGAIHELKLGHSSELFYGSVEKSIMRWFFEQDMPGGSLPYTAYHYDCYVHPAIMERFGLSPKSRTVAVSGWCKVSPERVMLNASSKQGTAFRTQQHLGNVRIFIL